jgi:copper(I)-binding protein
VRRSDRSPQGVDIPSSGQVDTLNGTVRLRPEQVSSPIQTTQLVPVTFVFRTAGQVTLDVPVATVGNSLDPSPSRPSAQPPADVSAAAFPLAGNRPLR